ncbi:hypothetical protein [Phenylobacterium sp.]|uniref:hypothetical protein n=1 Tax=Phenylobacterium sp. TaxID=1871053 RepID=UPI00356568BB
MLKVFLKATPFAMVIACICSASSAATLVQSRSCAGSTASGPLGAGFSEVTFSCPVTFNKFDGALGILTAVQLSVSLSDDVSVTGHNPTAEYQTIDFQGDNHTIQADLTAISGLPDYHIGTGHSGGQPTVVAPGSDYTFSEPFPLGFPAQISFVDPAGFVGSGAFEFLGVTDLKFTFVMSDPSLSYDVFASNDFSVDLTYFYAPPSPVPEPQIWMCLVLGLGFLGVRMRSRSRLMFMAPRA